MHKISKVWRQEEIQLLRNLKVAYPQNKWKKISKLFAENGFIRADYECREKWVNFIDPTINHGAWTQEQLHILFTEYNKHDSQWSKIQFSLPTRSQTKIKNQFYSTIRNIVRYLIKYFNRSSKENRLLSKVYPKTLKNIYEGAGKFSFGGKLMKEAVVEMDFKFQKKIFKAIINREENVWKRIYEAVESQSLGSKVNRGIERTNPGINNSIKNQHQEYKNSTFENAAHFPVQAFTHPPNVNIQQTSSHLYTFYFQPQPIPYQTFIPYYIPSLTQQFIPQITADPFPQHFLP